MQSPVGAKQQKALTKSSDEKLGLVLFLISQRFSALLLAPMIDRATVSECIPIANT